MKILLLHVDWIEWEPTKKALKQMEDIEKKKHRVEEALVVLTAVEKSDEKNPEEAALKLVGEIKDVAKQLKAKKVVLYPYAHLSKNLGSPTSSLLVFDKAEKILKKDFFVERAEFGWYKKLAFSAKGHPLSELSREIGPALDSKDNNTYTQLIELLDKYKAEYRLIDHLPEGRTEFASKLRDNKLSEAINCIVLMVKAGKKSKYVLAVVPGDAKVDFDAIKKLFKGTYVSFATKEITEKLTGCVSGTVLPLSFNSDLELVVDPKVLENDEMFFNAARLDQSVALKTKDYKRIIKPRLENIATYSGEKDIESEALKKEKSMISEWYIMEPNGKKSKIELKDKKIYGFNFSKHKNLEKFVKYELAKSRAVDKEPPHIGLMKKLQLVGYESGSDPGNLRFLPKGRLIKSLLEEWVTKKTIEYGAAEVETPLMYDYDHPALKKYLNRFPARQYTIKTPNKEVFLRFSCCFGQFLIGKDANISYKNLPLPFYELARYAFRVEQRGELAGLRRLRAFTMPDCHCLVKDFKQAKKEFMRRMKLSQEVQEGIGFDLKKDFEYAIRVTKDFFKDHKDIVLDLVKAWGKPILLELWDKKFFYFILKYEFNFVDALGKAAALTTDQIDVENAERFGIKYTDKDNKKKYPLILHLSPSGAIERVMYALLERASIEQKQGKNTTLPLWLSPTQVRLCPVNDSFLKDCEKLADQLKKENIRVDIDDNTESIQKKIRNAEMDWVPAIVVFGDKEKKSKKIAVRLRETGKIKQLSVKELVKWVKDQTKDMPFKPLSLPRLLSKRAEFVA